MQQLQKRYHLLFWLGLAVTLVAFLVIVNNILLPFVVGILVAYFLDPVADFLEERGMSRTLATAIITVSFFLIALIALLLLVPYIVDQVATLAQKMPGYIQNVREVVIPAVQSFLERYDISINLDELIDNNQETSQYAVKLFTQFSKNLLESGAAIINVISLILISPIVSFFMLRDWDVIIAKLQSWFPRKHEKTIKRLVTEMDGTLSGYVRGYTNVCLMLGIFYATGLLLVGLEFGFTIGFLTGLFSFIPYIGMAIGMIVGVIVALFQFGFDYHIALVIGVFAIGQFIEGNFITPKIVGEKIGLHPVWVIFALLAGGVLFGFTGILLAIPAAAMLGVLMRFGLQQYLKSPLYKPPVRRRKRTAH